MKFDDIDSGNATALRQRMNQHVHIRAVAVYDNQRASSQP
jgi:hypothetical protein